MINTDLHIDKTVRLFTYLKELSLLKAPLVRDLQNYEYYVFLNEIPDEDGCISPLFSKVKDTWVEIKKPVKPVFPHPPIALKDWLSTSYKPEDTTVPALQEKIPNPDLQEDTDPVETDSDSEQKYLYLEDHSDIQRTFDFYLAGKWNVWKEEFERYEKVQNIYTKLFSIYQKQKKLGDQYELIAAVGLLNWKDPNDQVIHRHIVTASCAFQFDANNGIIRVMPSSEGIKAELEQDMLELSNRLDNKALSPIAEKMEELQEIFWDQKLLNSICRSFAFSLSSNGTFHENELANTRETSKEPSIFYSPALILRKRNEKGFQQACNTIVENVKESAEEVPQGIKRIFEEIDDFHQSAGTQVNQSTGTLPVDSTIYFPLEANEDQQKIITNLETRNGVLVQGPPGTGKSHTIANLISHLLSTGKRVLITSETARALKVLKGKIPDELQSLCVSLLGADSKSFKDLEKVVQTISNKRDTWNSDLMANEIAELTNQLKEMRKEKAVLQNKMRSIREKETFQHNLLDGNYQGTAQKIAMTIYEEQDNYSWLKDHVDMDAECPITSSEAAELLELLSLLNENIQEEIQLAFPPHDLLDREDIFAGNVKRESSLNEEIKNYETANQDKLEILSSLTKDQQALLNKLLNEMSSLSNQIALKKQQWLSSAFQDLSQNRFRPWEEFYTQVIESLNKIKALASKHSLTEILGTDQVPLSQLLSDVSLLHAHLKEGKGLGVPLMRPKAVKDAWYIVKDVRVDGRKCDSLETVALLKEAVTVDQTLNRIGKVVQDQIKIDLSFGQSRSLNAANIEDLIEPFQLLLDYKHLMEKVNNEFGHFHLFKEFAISNEEISSLLTQLELLNLKEEINEIQLKMNSLIGNIQQAVSTNDQHQVVGDLIESIRNRDTEKYTKHIKLIHELDKYGRKSSKCEALLQKLKSALPKLYSNLLVTYEEPAWQERFDHLPNAMKWAKAKSWLIDFSNTNEKSLTKELNDLDKQIKSTISRLGAKKAWYSTLGTMTEGQRQHLLAWTTSMRKVGKGTGKNAHIHLKDAQKHMSECRDAIPAWIMPLYRVFETFDVKPNLFDVVIIDEASQSGPDAVILQYIAKKLIVVGDDKQISPEYVGIKREDVQYLRNQYLIDFKLADMLDIENSFFDLANVLFGGRITLREHFRCMPEIIEFSNRISYSNTPLIPLRQYPPNRLEPIKSVHVPSGYREGSGSKVFNQPEAEALVSQMKECINNPIYKGKSMGVISLQNEGQAQLIERLLVEEIGTEEIEKRNIICGDAYAFQGDERDIMFISMVAAPGQTTMRALATEKDKRRFNVAVSRAKDQLWLFHTPTVNDFRNKECFRYQLISYCEDPAIEILETNRSLCESDFERSVFDQITARGFKVIPQHEVAGYRIDMVIEGQKGRIAVECDGDQWHGPDRYDYDMNRQRILERCGWTFWRVRGSDYYFNPEKALSSLWDTLKYYEIEPMHVNDNGESNITESFSQPTEPILTASGEIAAGLEPVVSPPTENNTANNELLHEQVENEKAVTAQRELGNTPTESKNRTAVIDKTATPRSGLKQYLENLGYEVVDKREKGGALWLIGDQEFTDLIEELRKQKITFTFAYNGSKSTNRRAAWFTSYQG